jgi:hypothetical protein
VGKSLRGEDVRNDDPSLQRGKMLPWANSMRQRKLVHFKRSGSMGLWK